MNIQVGFEMTFEIAAPTAMVVLLETHPSLAGRLVRAGRLRTEPEVRIERFRDPFGNLCGRFVAPEGLLRLTNDAVVWDSGEPDPVPVEAVQHPVEELPAECLPYLLASRYCEVDLLNDRAWELFGGTRPGWERVSAVLDWVHTNVRYGYEFSRPTKTAKEVLEEKAGVCRDFQHLAITFCRALNVPARYAGGYLGDIGVTPPPTPMDFHAWFEVYLGGRWYAVDARHNQPRIGRVLMARGRDATDTALTTAFGLTTLRDFRVWADEVLEDPRSEAALDHYDEADEELAGAR